MKQQLLQLHRSLVSKGYHLAAKRLLTAMIHKSNLTIGDGFNEAYESGLAQWLQDNCRWYNNRNSFTAIL